MKRALLLVPLLSLFSGCGDGAGEPVQPAPPATEPELLRALDVAALQLPAPPAGSLPVDVGIFLGADQTTPASGWEAGAISRTRSVVTTANEVLAPCGLHLRVEAIQAVTLPPALMSVAGNHRGSWGGHPPPEAGDPDRFMYAQNERLTDESRTLFAYGKRHTGRNTISAFFVASIEYYIGQDPHAVGGLSYPPGTYHHVDDYPLRNSVLVAAQPADRVFAGASGILFAHELGHMLLNTGHHEYPPGNLMNDGMALTDAQCERMRANREWLFGSAAVPDPGPPA